MGAVKSRGIELMTTVFFVFHFYSNHLVKINTNGKTVHSIRILCLILRIQAKVVCIFHSNIVHVFCFFEFFHIVFFAVKWIYVIHHTVNVPFLPVSDY